MHSFSPGQSDKPAFKEKTGWELAIRSQVIQIYFIKSPILMNL